MLYNGLQVDFKCTQMTLGISMLKNIFPLHNKTQGVSSNVAHCAIVNVIM